MRPWFRRSATEQRSAQANLQRLSPGERHSVAIAAGLGILGAGLVAGLLWFVVAVVIFGR